MAPPFESSHVKIDRAKRHVAELKASEQRFIEDKCKGLVSEVDPATGNKIHKIKFSNSVPLECDGIVSDAANCLRDALDHAGSAVAVAIGMAGSRYAAFPFAGSAEQFEKSARGRCKDLPDEIFALFRSFKPYGGGNILLWAVNFIANSKKHDILKPMAVQSGSLSIHIHKITGGTFGLMAPFWDRAKNEIILAIESKDAKMDYDAGAQVFVAFDEIEGIRGQPAVPVLNALVGEVERVLSAIEAESRRLGYVS